MSIAEDHDLFILQILSCKVNTVSAGALSPCIAISSYGIELGLAEWFQQQNINTRYCNWLIIIIVVSMDTWKTPVCSVY